MTLPETAPPTTTELPAEYPEAHVHRNRRRRSHSHSRSRPRSRAARIVGFAILGLLVVVLGVGIALVVHYLPYWNDAQAARADATQLESSVRAVGLDVDRAHLDDLQAQLNELDGRVASFKSLFADDPLVGIAGNLPWLKDQVAGGAAVVRAADDLVQAGQIALGIGYRFVDLRATGAASSAGDSLLADIVQLMTTSNGEMQQISSLLDAADRELTKNVPRGAIGTIRDFGHRLAGPLADYRPILASYVTLEGALPGMLGWGGEKRYLVLAEDPAELRPTGGFTGSYGIVTFQNGRLTGHDFHNVFSLDGKPGLPYIQPPDGLVNHLLRDTSWGLADAAWSPDFPTAAQDALRIYASESGDTHIDGVIALTTYALDNILRVLGPVDVPGFNTTVIPGQATLQTLAMTRTSQTPNTDRKEFLDAFGNVVLDRLFTLGPSRWKAMLTQFRVIGDQRLAMAWFSDPKAEQIVSGTTWGGAVRQDTGDYLYVVDANVDPPSKYNLLVKRTTNLDVQIDRYGNAVNTLKLTWQNDAGENTDIATALRSYSMSPLGIYGTYTRVIAPDRSRLQSVIGGVVAQVGGAEAITSEFGRTVFANYLLVPPGSADLTYRWISPYPVDIEHGDPTYQLTIQKQPGMTPEPITVHVTAPDGTIITGTSAGMVSTNAAATYSGTLTQDITLTITYRSR